MLRSLCRWVVPALAVGVLAMACSNASESVDPPAEAEVESAAVDDATPVPEDAAGPADDALVLPEGGGLVDTEAFEDEGPSEPRLIAIVGDSISVRSEDEYLEAMPNDTVNVEAVTGAGIIGMRSAVTAAIAMEPDVLVIELGTNDAPRLERQDLLDVGAVLDEAAAVPCVRWVSIALPGDNDDRFNATLELQASARPGVEVVDWAELVERFPPFLDPDGVHPTEAGQLALAAAVASSIRDCDAAG